MKKILFLICTITISCMKKSNGSTTEHIQEITFLSFFANDLSEDQAHLSTKDDELFLVYGYILIDSSKNCISTNLANTTTQTMVKSQTIKLDKTFSMQHSNIYTPIIFIGAVEVDVALNQSVFLSSFKTEILNQPMTEIAKKWEQQTTLSSAYNDNLGIVLFYPYLGHQTYNIAGSQLGDKYQYIFETSIQ